jgi:tetratricopeptide (TPR) repeat protein
MKAQVSWAVLLLCLGCAQSAAVAQKAPAQRTVAVVVVDGHIEPAQPVPVVRVVLSYLYNSVRVSGLRGVTNPKGQTWLDVPEDAAQGGGLRIEIIGAANLVIYQPADGQLAALPATITVSMLPKGSPALLGPAQIEAMLHRTLVQVTTLQKQVSTLKQNVAAAQGQKPDLGAAIAEWAETNGFSPTQVDQQVQQWAQGIQQQSAQATTAEQKALAELALKHYENAAQLFNAASDADRQQISTEDSQEQSLEAQEKALEAAQQALLSKQRTSMQQLLDHSQQAAGAYQLDLEYHQATQALMSAETAIEAEYKKHSDDKGFHVLWLQAVWAVASARWREGKISPASESLTLLAQAAADFDSQAHEYAAMGERQAAAAAQFGLGNALMDEGERASGDKAAALLDRAVQAFRSALEVRTKADLPKDWANTQNNLGIVLEDEGERASGDQAAALFDQAVQAFRSTLEVRSKADGPQDWAQTQSNLGAVLLEEGERASGDRSGALFNEAVQADRYALEVYTKADFPEVWAQTQSNLGDALQDEGERVSADQVAALLDQAVQAYRSALEVFTKADLPQSWASVQNNLGSALWDEGERASGDKAAALFDQAVQAFRSALELRSKADLPQSWAMTQNNLGNALMDEGERARGDKAAALLDQAVQAYRSALEVFTKADLPQSWATTQCNLGIALDDEGKRASGDKAAALFDQAVQAYRSALEVFTKEAMPQGWAQTENNLAIALGDEGRRASGDKAAALFDQAVQAYRSALEVYTKADLPQQWADAQSNLGAALENEGARASGDQAAALFDQAVQADRRALEVRTRADLPQDWATTEANLMGLYHDMTFQFADALNVARELVDFNPNADNRMNLLEAELTGADFQECIQQAAKLDDNALAQEKGLMPVRDVIGFACQWGARENAAALAADQRFLARVQADPSFSRSGWTFKGTLHFLSQSPAFASGRTSWLALFTAVQNRDSAGMSAALHQLEPTLQQ